MRKQKIYLFSFLLVLTLLVGVSFVDSKDAELVSTNTATTPSYSPCVDTPRIACVPQGGGYNYVTGDVVDAYGNVVSTKSERSALDG